MYRFADKGLFLFTLLIFSGCSKQYWTANFYMMKAESAVMKAHELKAKKAPYEKRLPFYRQACFDFLKAFEADPKIFTLNRIQEAADSCWRVEETEVREKFLQFEEQYAKEHPREYEYGEAGVVGVADNL